MGFWEWANGCDGSNFAYLIMVVAMVIIVVTALITRRGGR